MPKWGGAYLFLQSAAVLIWWIALSTDVAFRALFFPPEHERVLFGLAVPDLLAFVLFGVVAAIATGRYATFAKTAIAIIAGAAGYAGLFALSLIFTTPNGWISFTCMLPMMAINGYLCWRAFR